MDIFNLRKVVNLKLLGNLVVELTYDDGSQGTYSNVLWSVNVDANGEGSLHLSQGGAVGGIGFFGYRVTADNPLSINGSPTTSIQDVEDYFISDLT